MAVRIAFDLDGVLADFAAAYGRIADRINPESRRRRSATEEAPAAAPAAETAEPANEAARDRRAAPNRRRVWKAIRSTPDFWLTLDPIDADVIPRLYERAVSGRWEVFFVTQRPATAGDTVQRQSQLWLAKHGFELPSVIVHQGSRGALAAALEVDALVDDTVENCVDVVSQSRARAILVAPEADDATDANAKRLGIELCSGPAAAVDLLDAATEGPAASFLRRAVRAGTRGRP